MKICRKCKKKYKDAYSFCPKCGTSYDKNIKRAKIKTKKIRSSNIVVNIILYVIGGLTLLISLMTIVEEPVSSIFGILFSFSTFDFVYTLIESKWVSLSENNLKLIRILAPIVLFIIWGSVL